MSGTILGVKANPEFDFILEENQEQARMQLDKENPLILMGAPPCTVFSAMQNINAKHNIGESWEDTGIAYVAVCGVHVLGSNCEGEILST